MGRLILFSLGDTHILCEIVEEIKLPIMVIMEVLNFDFQKKIHNEKCHKMSYKYSLCKKFKDGTNNLLTKYPKVGYGCG